MKKEYLIKISKQNKNKFINLPFNISNCLNIPQMEGKLKKTMKLHISHRTHRQIKKFMKIR